MKFGVSVRRVLWLCLSLAFALDVAAQSVPLDPPKILRIDYGKAYQLQDSYSIIYDNTAQSAKLQDFRVAFYGPGRQELAVTDTETHSLSSKIKTYRLASPVTGFTEVELSILSLHSGDIEDFPANIGEILALNELIEVPDPSDDLPTNEEEIENNPIETELPTATPGLLDEEMQRLSEARELAAQRLSELRNKIDAFQSEAEAREPSLQEVDTMLAKVTALSTQTEDAPLKSEINALGAKIERVKMAVDMSDERQALSTAETALLTLQSQIEDLVSISEMDGTDPAVIASSLSDIETELAALNTAIAVTAMPEAIAPAQLRGWQADYLEIQAQMNAPPAARIDWRIIIAALLLGLIVIGLAAKFLLGARSRTRPLKSALERPEAPGVIFPASPMLTGNVAAPLAPAGQLAAAQLQMLNGPYSVLRDGYLATGRIGYAQEGVPTAEDYGFGTGFLVSDRHVMTNRHVHGMYGHYLLDESDPGGIEFIAEKGKDASDFVPFNCEPPLLLPGLDIAIYTLARPVKNRKPMVLAPKETDGLDGQEIVVIGYPDTHTPEKPDILAVVEDNPVFAVKRLSQGRIFRHSTDLDTRFGVETTVVENKSAEFLMPAICHNASTLSGNSGSPLLDIKTGKLLGVHFAGFKVFNGQEAANLAMAIAQLTDKTAEKHLTGVTSITGRTRKTA